MGAVFSMCPHLFCILFFCILAGNLLASGHKTRIMEQYPRRNQGCGEAQRLCGRTVYLDLFRLYR